MLLRLLAVDLSFLHHLAHAHVEGLELEEQAQALEHRNPHLLPAHVGAFDVAPALADGRRAAVVDQDLLEGVEVDLEVEAVGGVLGQDEVYVGGVHAREIALLQQLGHLPNEPLLHDRALFSAVGARLQQIGVRAERLVGLLELEQLHGVGMTAPIARDSAGSGAPGRRRRSATDGPPSAGRRGHCA